MVCYCHCYCYCHYCGALLLLLWCARRILFCYSRDGAVAFSDQWIKVNPYTKSPLNALWMTAVCTLLIGLPMLGSTVRESSSRGCID